MCKLFVEIIQKSFGILVVLCVFLAAPGFGQEKQSDKIVRLEKEIQLLSDKIKKLQDEFAQITKSDSTNDEDEALLKELEAELAPKTKEQEKQLPQISDKTLKARQQVFQNMNPNVSVIGSFFSNASNQDGLERNVNLGLGEAEFAFLAAVDPYARADFYIGFGRHKENLGGGAESEDELHGEEEGGLSTELEEAYLTLLTLPHSMQLKLGKFRPKFGKINETHPHAYNFIGLPLMYQNFFGGEGLVDEGASLNWLLPNTKFFQELTLSILNGPAENASFTRAETDNFLYLAHLRNFFDLSDNTSLEIGLGGMSGPHNETGDRTTIFSTDITLKWKPLQFNKLKSFEWQTEALLSRREELGSTIESFGLFSHLRYQLSKRWYLGYLIDYSEFPETNKFNQTAHSGILQFFATEFQKFEIQGRYNTGNLGDDFFDIQLRGVFVIGAHGAHQY
ncbi:hypothetical protein IIC38_14090 [candidate division KSB1 bacterium]|nr:hypothetical protein [candidate division KSB1 bacterium]